MRCIDWSVVFIFFHCIKHPFQGRPDLRQTNFLPLYPLLRDWQGSKLLPPLQRAGKRHLVDKFQMPADRDAVR